MEKKRKINNLHKKRLYQTYKHHAWAGTCLLSVFLAIRLIFPSYEFFLNPVIFVVIIYIVVSLILTYRYRDELKSDLRAGDLSKSDDIELKKLDYDLERDKLKLEKKKAKTEAKKSKKNLKD